MSATLNALTPSGFNVNEPLTLSATTLSFRIGLVGAGLFLFWGMALGVWKYVHMRQPPSHAAPVYVDIAHQAALMYAFACLVLAMMGQFSCWPEVVNVSAVVVNLVFFASAVGSYVVHGWLGTDQTQFRRTNLVTTWGTWGLIVGELGGTAILLAGVILGL